MKLYKLKYAHYPASLTELVPEFILQIPRDEIDGGVLKFDVTRGYIHCAKLPAQLKGSGYYLNATFRRDGREEAVFRKK